LVFWCFSGNYQGWYKYLKKQNNNHERIERGEVKMKKKHRRHLRMAILGGPLYFGDLEVAKDDEED
jgi:hypothetical protein